MHTRVNTNDEKVVENVLVRNEYRLPEAFHPEDVIVDIGAHIGSFARACLARGAREVHSYEPHPENYQHLLRNVARYAYRRAKPFDRAVTPGDRGMVALKLDATNTGGHSVVYGEGEGTYVPATPIRTVLERARNAAPNGRIRLLKLDCEGSEYDLLYGMQSGDFDTIDEITGEIHSFGEEYGRTVETEGLAEGRTEGRTERTREALIEYLGGFGYTVETWNEMSDGLILFRAYREETVTERPPEPVRSRNAGRSDTDTQPSGVPGTDDAPSDRSGGTGSSPRLRSRSKRRPTDTDDSTDV